jgi:dipeptidase E
MKKLLLLSNSTLPDGDFLDWPEPYIKEFLGNDVKRILFFPFAGVTISFEEYYEKVDWRFVEMGYHMENAHLIEDKQSAIADCEAIVVGGGNTFQLLHHLQDGWIDLIREKVHSGTPYIGWSAGSNVACPTIKTTNDMPIVEPKSFEALNLVPFQINPHYTEEKLPNHGGETRPDRIKEYLEVHHEMTVYGIPEGSLLEILGSQYLFSGTGRLAMHRFKKEIQYFDDGELI